MESYCFSELFADVIDWCITAIWNCKVKVDINISFHAFINPYHFRYYSGIINVYSMDQCIRHYGHNQIKFTLFCESCVNVVICDLWYIFHILYFQMLGSWCATMPLNHYHHHNIVFVVYWFPKKEPVIKSVTKVFGKRHILMQTA